MDISYFELIVLNAACLAIVWLTLGSCPRVPLPPILQYSRTPILPDELFGTLFNASDAAFVNILFEFEPPNSDRPRSSIRPCPPARKGEAVSLETLNDEALIEYGACR